MTISSSYKPELGAELLEFLEKFDDLLFLVKWKIKIVDEMRLVNVSSNFQTILKMIRLFFNKV